MLIKSSLHSSNDIAFTFASDPGKEVFLYDWMDGVESWQMGPKCCEIDAKDHCTKPALVKQEKKVVDGSSSCQRSSQLSTVSIRSGISAPNLVYRRRKLLGNSMAMLATQESENTKASGRCTSASSPDAPSAAALIEPVVSSIENIADVVRHPDSSRDMHNIQPLTLKSDTVNLCSVGEGRGSDDSSKNGFHGTTELSSANDSCSSSKSSVGLGSACRKQDVGNTGECSSSDALQEIPGEDLSAKDICISILRSHGLLGVWHARKQSSCERIQFASGHNHSLSCQVCDHPESAMNMLVCDNCEEAYHVACCYPRIKNTNIDEWICHSCMKKKNKLMKGATSQRHSLSIKSEKANSSKTSILRDKWGPIAFMLRDTEPYTSGVRVGKAFQAEIPDLSAPITNDNNYDDLVEMDPLESVQLHERKHNNDSRVSSIGNWLQCQEVIDGIGEGARTICGKWRRAPLFEVQTDCWDCFRSVLWDPTHSDCAVPQELETDQVLKQLKYMEMLRPSLNAKRQKVDRKRCSGSQDPKDKAKIIQSS